MTRSDGRQTCDIRPLTLTRGWLPNAEGSCLVELGKTRIITTASVSDGVPPWRRDSGSGWVTAEYGMLPRSTNTRMRRPQTAGQVSGRTMEIQRLIGRALRSVTRLDAIGERTIQIDCDVLMADGGTRTASIIGAAVALHDALGALVDSGALPEHPMTELVAAVSLGLHDGVVLTDLCYEEDSAADVDMNIVMSESGGLIEVQGTAEAAPFGRKALDTMLDDAERAIREIVAAQHRVLEDA